MTTVIASRVLPALVAGTATAAYYATPDVIASRSARGWTKAGLMAVVLATSVPDLRATLAEWRQKRRDRTQALAEGGPDAVPVRGTVAGLGAGAGLAASTVAGTVVVERWIFRRGQVRAAAGERLPHTRAGLLYGALAAGLTLVPMPSQSPSSPTGR